MLPSSVSRNSNVPQASTPNPTPQSTAEAEQLLKLYELQRKSLDERRGVEWKVALGFYGAIGVATGFMLQKVQLPFWSWWFYVILFTIYAFGWLGKHFHSDQIDHNWIDVYRSHAENRLGIPTTIRTYQYPPASGFLRSGWWWSEALVTFLFLVASWWLLSTTAPIPPRP